VWKLGKRSNSINHLPIRAFDRVRYDHPPEVTDRKIVNMFRHEYINYHTLLNSLFRRVGRWKAYPIIKDRVNTTICEKIGIPLTDDISGDSDKEFVKEYWGELP